MSDLIPWERDNHSTIINDKGIICLDDECPSCRCPYFYHDRQLYVGDVPSNILSEHPSEALYSYPTFAALLEDIGEYSLKTLVGIDGIYSYPEGTTYNTLADLAADELNLEVGKAYFVIEDGNYYSINGSSYYLLRRSTNFRVLVAPGTYDEDVAVDESHIGQLISFSFIGEDVDTTIITGNIFAEANFIETSPLNRDSNAKFDYISFIGKDTTYNFPAIFCSCKFDVYHTANIDYSRDIAIHKTYNCTGSFVSGPVVGDNYSDRVNPNIRLNVSVDSSLTLTGGKGYSSPRLDGGSRGGDIYIMSYYGGSLLAQGGEGGDGADYNANDEDADDYYGYGGDGSDGGGIRIGRSYSDIHGIHYIGGLFDSPGDNNDGDFSLVGGNGGNGGNGGVISNPTNYYWRGGAGGESGYGSSVYNRSSREVNINAGVAGTAGSPPTITADNYDGPDAPPNGKIGGFVVRLFTEDASCHISVPSQPDGTPGSTGKGVINYTAGSGGAGGDAPLGYCYVYFMGGMALDANRISYDMAPFAKGGDGADGLDSFLYTDGSGDYAVSQGGRGGNSGNGSYFVISAIPYVGQYHETIIAVGGGVCGTPGIGGAGNSFVQEQSDGVVDLLAGYGGNGGNAALSVSPVAGAPGQDSGPFIDDPTITRYYSGGGGRGGDGSYFYREYSAYTTPPAVGGDGGKGGDALVIYTTDKNDQRMGGGGRGGDGGEGYIGGAGGDGGIGMGGRGGDGGDGLVRGGDGGGALSPTGYYNGGGLTGGGDGGDVRLDGDRLPTGVTTFICGNGGNGSDGLNAIPGESGGYGGDGGKLIVANYSADMPTVTVHGGNGGNGGNGGDCNDKNSACDDCRGGRGGYGGSGGNAGGLHYTSSFAPNIIFLEGTGGDGGDGGDGGEAYGNRYGGCGGNGGYAGCASTSGVVVPGVNGSPGVKGADSPNADPSNPCDSEDGEPCP